MMSSGILLCFPSEPSETFWINHYLTRSPWKNIWKIICIIGIYNFAVAFYLRAYPQISFIQFCFGSVMTAYLMMLRITPGFVLRYPSLQFSSDHMSCHALKPGHKGLCHCTSSLAPWVYYLKIGHTFVIVFRQ